MHPAGCRACIGSHSYWTRDVRWCRRGTSWWELQCLQGALVHILCLPFRFRPRSHRHSPGQWRTEKGACDRACTHTSAIRSRSSQQIIRVCLGVLCARELLPFRRWFLLASPCTDGTATEATATRHSTATRRMDTVELAPGTPHQLVEAVAWMRAPGSEPGESGPLALDQV